MIKEINGHFFFQFAPIVTTRCPLVPLDVYLYKSSGIKHQVLQVPLLTGFAKLAEMGWLCHPCAVRPDIALSRFRITYDLLCTAPAHMHMIAGVLISFP